MSISISPYGWQHWLRARFFFALVLPTSVALALFAGWHVWFDSWPGPRLHLNLGLAWVPYLCSLWAVASAERSPRPVRPMLLPGVLWLAFFPNAPYLVTDWLYVENLEEHLWYGIALFTAFSSCGLLLAVISLYLMHTLVRVHLGRTAGLVVVGVVVVLSGFGVYLGRFLRLNSWDLVLRPGAVLDALARLNKPEDHAGPLAFTVMFTVLLSVGYLVFQAIRRAPRSREEQQLA
jgi:uncharacterized membrane protein